MAAAKSRKTGPPKTMIAINASAVVTEVITVLDNVSFNDLLMISFCSQLLYLLKFSRILSNTTTVSFIEYPAIVRIAAIVARLNSNEVSEKNPIVDITSWLNARIAAMEYCHSNLNHIYII